VGCAQNALFRNRPRGWRTSSRLYRSLVPMEEAPASTALPGQSTGIDGRYDKRCAAHDVARFRGDGIFGIRRAHVPFDANGADRCHSGSLPGERARAVAGLRDGVGQPCMSCAFRPAENAVRDQGLGRYPWRPVPTSLDIMWRSLFRWVR
jgi:hypothetical protein